MTLAQIKTLIIGVLKKWFTNKSTLDKFAEAEGKLTYNGSEISASISTYSSDEISQAVTETIAELNSSK